MSQAPPGPIAPAGERAPFAAVVFDMDGVLLDSAALHARAFREALADVVLNDFDYADIAGLRTDDAVRSLLAGAGRAVEASVVRDYVKRKRDRYAELVGGDLPVMPGAARVVKAIALAGMRVALASSGSQASVSAFLEASGLVGVFACALHGGDVSAAKPAPDIYLLAAQRLGASAGELLVVEDSTAGVLAAKAAGSAVAAFRPTDATRRALASYRHFVIDDLESVVDLARGSRT